LATKRKKIESLPQLSPPSPADVNLLVKQPQSSVLDIRTPIPNTQDHFSRKTEEMSTLKQEDRLTHNLTGLLLAATNKQVSNVPQQQNAPHSMQDPQPTSNHSLAVDVPDIFTDQVNCQPQRLALQSCTNTKQRRHQHRLCCKCRQTGHFKTHCRQLTTK